MIKTTTSGAAEVYVFVVTSLKMHLNYNHYIIELKVTTLYIAYIATPEDCTDTS